MTATAPAETTTYTIEGRLLEVCTCAAVCPCWVGMDPDGGSCEGVVAWWVDQGTVQGVDVSDRGVVLSASIPGNVLAGGWKVVVYVDDRCSEEQQQALLSVFSGQLGGAVADLAALIGEIVAVERAPMTFTAEGGEGTLKVGDVVEARITPFQGATGQATQLRDTVFSTIPGSPAFPGTAPVYRRTGALLGTSDIDLSGKNSVQGAFRFSA
ncbi:DUF1326 domain-containing protein [Pseudonocardia bannensis]|uniref:DUF1326 domain-containing protein n=1 Tax=Pseudonocardia bannensis TaxID=630973 RepID=A0A848DF97_9PSEU|nr:DUF1326 domain-containing protein [Pseudonocardia bannensis]NMH91302.1 DUF1326 domain-containing protein [Pseudonocardia bannensis]